MSHPHKHFTDQALDFWLARGAVLVIVGLQIAIVNDLMVGPRWLAPAIELALLIPLLFYAGDSVYARIRKQKRRVKFRGLLLASLIMVAAHVLMDWTNNYGVRPLLPWSGKWYYGDLVFIADPWIWLVVGGAAFLLTSKRTWQKIFWAALALLLTALVLLFPLENAGVTYPNVFRVLWIAAIIALIFTCWTTRLVSRYGLSS